MPISPLFHTGRSWKRTLWNYREPNRFKTVRIILGSTSYECFQYIFLMHSHIVKLYNTNKFYVVFCSIVCAVCIFRWVCSIWWTRCVVQPGQFWPVQYRACGWWYVLFYQWKNNNTIYLTISITYMLLVYVTYIWNTHENCRRIIILWFIFSLFCYTHNNR